MNPSPGHVSPLRFEAVIMPDAKGVEGPQPRPSLLRAAAARRPIRKPGDPVAAPGASGSGTVPAPAAPSMAPAPVAPPADRTADKAERAEQRPARGTGARLDDLYRMPMPQLFKLAEKEGIHEHTGMSRAQLIVGIVRRQIERGEVVRGSGTLEVLPDGYGFLRSQAHTYLDSPEDISVSPSTNRRMSLRTGLVVEGPIRLPIEGQEDFAIMKVESINGRLSEDRHTGNGFGELTREQRTS